MKAEINKLISKLSIKDDFQLIELLYLKLFDITEKENTKKNLINNFDIEGLSDKEYNSTINGIYKIFDTFYKKEFDVNFKKRISILDSYFHDCNYCKYDIDEFCFFKYEMDKYCIHKKKKEKIKYFEDVYNEKKSIIWDKTFEIINLQEYIMIKHLINKINLKINKLKN